MIISKIMRLVAHEAYMGPMRKAFDRGEETTQRPRCRWEDNIKMNLRKRGWEGVDWIHLVQDRGW
jgi:hypothetical protein